MQFIIGSKIEPALYSTKSPSTKEYNVKEYNVNESIQKSLKLISLNIWGGHIQQPLLEFIKLHRDIDIFCLQEVYNNALHKVSTDDNEVSLNIFSEMSALLPKHNAFFTPVVGEGYGIGIFIKKEIDILSKGETNIHDNHNYIGRAVRLTLEKCNGLNIVLMTKFILSLMYMVYGMGCGKTDTQERINQSQRIKNFVDTINTPKILCGDFNLTLDTKSIKILENSMHNLIKIYNIKSTRTNIYTKEEKFADYIFTSFSIPMLSIASASSGV